MTISSLAADCQLCSVISKSNGEDPIGSAKFADGWLVMELPLPWTEDRFHSDPLLQPIHDLFHALYDQGIQVAPMAIAPDREYSVPNLSHVFYYRRPNNAFAQFEKQTFLLPPAQIIGLINALLSQPENLHRFLAYQQPTDSIRDLMVCTHGNIDIACARLGQPIYRQLRETYVGEWAGGRVDGWESGRVDDSKTAEIEKPRQPTYPSTHLPIHPSTHPPTYPSTPLRVWRCSHFGGHQFAPTLIDFPTGQVWGHLEPQILAGLINRDCPVTELRPFYRGWSGLNQYAQIVEREIWMQRGWDWLHYRKVAQVLAQDPDHEPWDADWAEVRLEFVPPDGQKAGAYEARVEVWGSVMTAHNSGAEPVSVKQYRVSRLVQVA
ncbi:sucrase ferredoxin [Leptolyngbya sp. KIOST-1]|uniref:sucrase ferredoxin n=1 Tax=Leptolyngbya sp. KIOST-1 TaxID=1229172 RepID=UPI00055AF91F|nr:sucrase ferredoxin [Leptolyngbya sp. KIOST-1]